MRHLTTLLLTAALCAVSVVSTPGSAYAYRNVRPGMPDRVAVISDSYTNGTNFGGQGPRSWPAQAGRNLEAWGVPITADVAAEGRAGYVVRGDHGSIFRDLTARAVRPDDALVVFFGARNNKMFTPQPDPYKTCRPFNAERFGVMLGEGAAMFVLERAERARRRGAMVHGRLRGYATLADGYHPSSPEPEGRWEQRVMELAVADAKLPGGVDDVDAVVAASRGQSLRQDISLAATG